MAEKVKDLIEDSGITEYSLNYYLNHRTELGTVKTAKCGPGHLEIEGDEGHMRLSGCTCGYAGEGPHGTAKILRDLGVSETDAERIMQAAIFEVLFIHECAKPIKLEES